MFPYPVGMALDDASRTWQQQEQLRMQAAMLRWSGRHGLELPTDALLRRMLPPPPAAPTKSTALLATKGAPTPLRSAARTAEASGLRAEAPAFVPGGERSGGAGAGPPVISVKKSSRGFAVVLLRDPAVIERGVQQRVAVIDGVCVEVRRHASKRLTEDGEEERGLFIACGAKVASKVTITVDGIEAYFNALAGAPCDGGLVVKRPFEESCVSYPVRSSGKLLPLSASPGVEAPGPEHLLGGEFCGRELVENLWAQKARLDDLWKLDPPPLARNVITRVARAQMFPHSGEGGKDHENRAGDKLAELCAAVGLLDGVPRGSCFLDLCGGPGAWSQHLLGQGGLDLRGFGFTLRTDTGDAEDWQAQDKDQWYPDLCRDRRWKALWGADGSGDLLKPGNVEHCARQLLKEGGCVLCVADGGFSDKAIPPNRLELYFYRLLLGELLMACSCLRKGGRFVCKMYTTLSPATSALLYLTSRLFEQASIVKPMSSRVTGPERYLVAVGFRGEMSGEVASIKAALQRAHDFGAGRSPLTTPLLTPVVAAEDLARDGSFSRTSRAMAEGLAERQAMALGAVVDRHLELEKMAMAVAESAGTSQRASYERVEKDRSDYEKHRQRKEAFAEEVAGMMRRQDDRRHGASRRGGR